MRIETIAPPSYFAWRWMAKKRYAFCPSVATLVKWRLTATESNGTRLVMTESGFAEAKQRQMNEQGWTAELGDLRHYLNVGS